MAAICALLQAGSLVNQDVGSHLVLANRLMAGGSFYDEILDPNPPLIFWLLVVPNFIASVSGFGTVAVFRVLVLIGAVISVFCVYAVSRAQGSTDSVTGAVVAVTFAVGLFLLVGPHFGQREHLMMVLVAPYIVVAAARGEGGPTSSCASFAFGAAAGVGFALKPQFLLVWAALEWAARRPSRRDRSWRYERVGVLAVVALYGIALLTYGRRYVTDVVPLLRVAYGAYDPPMGDVLQSMIPECVLLAAAAALMLGSARVAGAPVWMAFAVSAAFLYPLAGKGWAYHAYPLATATLLCAVLSLERFLRRLTSIRVTTTAQVALASVVLALLMVRLEAVVRTNAAMLKDTERRTAVGQLATAIDAAASGRRVYALSTNVSPVFPSVNYSSAVWGSRFNCLWLLPAVANARNQTGGGRQSTPMEVRKVEAALLGAVLEDLGRSQPALIIVDDRPAKQGIRAPHFDLLRYFQGDRRIAAFMRDYEEVGVVAGMRLMRRSGHTAELGAVRMSAGSFPTLLEH